MNNEFKSKLEAYEKGELADSELVEFEKELEKLELYQEYLGENKPAKAKDSHINDKKVNKILRGSKWKARIQTALSALGIILVVTIISSMLTAGYYLWGTPDRGDVLRNIIDYTLTVTEPYADTGGTSSNSKPFFGLEATRDLNKIIGNDTIKVGELNVNFLFSMMSFPEREYFDNELQNSSSFSYPGVKMGNQSDWNMLGKLPEGTVVSAYVSLAELTDTKQVFKLVEGKDLRLIWLAVDTGKEGKKSRHEGIIFDPIGFPSSPIWHDDDMILDSREVEKGLFSSRIISEGHSSPDYREGDQKIYHKQFFKTLNFLKQHEKKANKLVFEKLDLSKRIDFLEKNGVQHYGIVLTGPTKEVLKLQTEAWVGDIQVDEVDFWNWN